MMNDDIKSNKELSDSQSRKKIKCLTSTYIVLLDSERRDGCIVFTMFFFCYHSSTFGVVKMLRFST